VGCLRALFVRVGCLVLLVATLVFGFIYREQVIALYRKLRGLPVEPEVTYVLPAAGSAEGARRTLEPLAQQGGPAYVDLSAADLAALLEAELGRAPLRGLDSIAVGVGGSLVHLRAVVDLGRVPERVLGPLAPHIRGWQPVAAAGTLAADSAGGLWWTITRLSVSGFPFPRSTIPALLRELDVPGLEEASVPVPVPAGVGDVRVTSVGVRAYRASPR
jgi:hypothetical protein